MQDPAAVIRLLRRPSLAVAALLLLAQGSARVLLECATRAHPPAGIAASAMDAKLDSDAHAHHGAGGTQPGASHVSHDAGMASLPSDASPACEESETPCAPGDDSARCDLMLGCAAPGAPGVAIVLATASVAAVAIPGPALEPVSTHREPATPPPRG